MDAALTVSFTDPAVRSAKRVNLVCYSCGLSAAGLERIVAAVDPRAVADAELHQDRSATLVMVELAGGVPVRVSAWKGLLGFYEIFYARLGDGGWYLTDHFHNAMAAIPVARRGMTDDALLRHYVGANVYDRATYAVGIERISYGDRVDIDITSGETKVRNFSRHTSTAIEAPIKVHLDRLDGALEDYLSPLRSIPGLSIGFSGGVDSTLLLTYLGTAATPLTLVPGCPEFDLETDYAREAASLLGREITEIHLREADYGRHLEHDIESLGMPIESYIVPVLAQIFQHESPTFISGEGADSAFGSGRGLRRLASLLSGRMERGLVRRLEGDGALGRRARQLSEYAALFAEPARSPQGYAGTALEYHGDMSATLHMFGEEAIVDLNARMLQTVIDRIEPETMESDRFAHHIELTQWRLIFSDLALTANHDAHVAGKKNIQPYLSWAILSEHLKVPAKQRYYRGFTGKWMLKELLARRVDGYETNKRKLATGLPFKRYVESGPLTGIWDRYEIPALIPEELRSQVRTAATPLTWKAMTHAIWEDRVATNSGLEPHPATRSDTWPLREIPG
jgi:asparagine synthetase B (glutamine-hydrolysing)